MMFEPFRPWVSPTHRVRVAVEPWQQRAAAALRRRVFCAEQGLFDDDADAVDAHALTIVALASQCGQEDDVVGTVRIHAGSEPGEWWGSRLAVERAYRGQAGIGTSLIRLAVSSAHARGCTRFLAHVQSANALFFQRLHWTSLGELDFHGRPHHLMEASLAQYPPIHDGALGFETRTAEVA